MSAHATDLTTLPTVKAWLGLTTATDDVLLQRLITSLSRTILGVLSRSLLFQTYLRVIDGHGGTSLVLPDYPVFALTALTINGVPIPASPDGLASGYVVSALDQASHDRPSVVSLIGYTFARGKQNVTITYSAGWRMTDTLTIPSAAPYQITPSRSWRQDLGVAFVNGAALTAVSANPTAGQYVAPVLTDATPVYVFAAANLGQSVTLTYSYIDEPVEQACCELVERRYRQRGRGDEKAKTLAGEVISYDLDAISDYVQTALNPYQKVVPI